MGLNPNHLHRDEEIVLDLHPHWIMLVKAILAVVVTIVVGIFLLTRGWDNVAASGLKILMGVLIVASLLYLLQRWIAWYSTNFVVTTDRCIYREGIITKKGVEIPLERINTVFFHQGLIERMLRAGDLTIESAGEMGVQRFEDVRDPVSVQNVLYQEMEDNENRKFDRVRAPAPGPGAPGPTSSSVADELTKLVNLHEQGYLTDAEFETQKAALLNRRS
ncbi:MAG: PH domain-containing protein [Acidimicrobiales bacterium]